MAQISTTQCDLCSKNDCSMFCYECKQTMCQSCRACHDKILSTSRHTVRDWNKVGRFEFQSQLECSTHQKLCMFFCNKCKCSICCACVLEDHNGHRFSRTEEIFKDARQNALDLVSKGKGKLEEINEEIYNVNSRYRQKVEQDSNKVERQIKSTAEALHEIIDIVKEVRLNEVTNYKQLENKQIDGTVKKLEKLNVDYANATSTIDQLLKETHDARFYQSYDKHHSTFDKLDDIPNYPKPDDIRAFNEEAFFENILLKITERFKR